MQFVRQVSEKNNIYLEEVLKMNDNKVIQGSGSRGAAPVSKAGQSKSKASSARLSLVDVQKATYAHYIATMVKSDGRPVADDNYTFSETSSYVMLRAIQMNDKKTFDRVWSWTQDNLLRSNIKSVFFANSHKNRSSDWRQDPDTKDRSADLLAWRYDPVKKIQVWDWTRQDQDKQWVDGFDAAPDGDLLVAHSLRLAAQKWNPGDQHSTYLKAAKKIASALWENCMLEVATDTQGSAPIRFSELNLWKENNNATVRLLADGGATVEVGSENTWGGIAGLSGLGLKNIADFNSLELTITSAHPGSVLLLFQTQGGAKEYAVAADFAGGNVSQQISAPIDRLEEYKGYLGLFTSVGVAAGTVLDNFAIQAKNGTVITINDIKLVKEGGSGTSSQNFAFSSNDKKSKVINASYQIPFAITSMQAIDPQHQWQASYDSLYDWYIPNATKAGVKYSDAKHPSNIYVGGGIKAPDWNSIGPDGGIFSASDTLASFATNKDQDTHLSSWDAGRLELWIAMDYLDTGNPRAKAYLDKLETFYTQKLNEDNWIYNAFTVDGNAVTSDLRGSSNKEKPFGLAIAFAVLATVAKYDPSVQPSAKKAYSLLMGKYHKDGYFGKDPKDYFTANIIAFALETAKKAGFKP